MSKFQVKGYRVADVPLTEDSNPEPSSRETLYIPAGTYVSYWSRKPGFTGRTLQRGVVREVYVSQDHPVSSTNVMVCHRTGTRYEFWTVYRREVFRAFPE
jgi:hypothetical protein